MNEFQSQIKLYIEKAYENEYALIKFIVKEYFVDYEEIHEIHIASQQTRIVITNCHSNNIEFYIKTDDFIEWIDSQPQKPQTDWSKVAVDTPIIVTLKNSDKEKYFFHKYDCESEKVFYYQDGRPSRTTLITVQLYNVPLARVEIDLTAPLPLNWIKNTGKAPNCSNILARRKDGGFINKTYVCDIAFYQTKGREAIEEYLILD